jgi:hypothetical protein
MAPSMCLFLNESFLLAYSCALTAAHGGHIDFEGNGKIRICYSFGELSISGILTPEMRAVNTILTIQIEKTFLR